MENQTLTIALTLVGIITSAALLMNWASNRQIPGLANITLGYSLTCLGILLFSTQGSLTPVISVVLANSLILVGRVPTLIGFAAFWNQEATKLPLYLGAGLVLTLIAFTYFALVDESVYWRVRVYTPMAVAFSISTAYILFRGLRIERKLRPVMMLSSNLGAGALILLFGFNAVAEFILMFLRADVPPTGTDATTSILLLGSIFTLLVFSFGVIIMTMEELRVEHQENAIFDPITTILNHRTFLEVGQRVMGVALRYTKPVSLLTIEIENMETLITKHGHKLGNDMLRHFSLMATDRRRNEDVLARSSFNEFVMLLPGVDETGAQIVIDKIEKALALEDYVLNGQKLDLIFHVAAVTKREEDLHLQQMLQEGEVELYRLKQSKADLQVS